MTNKQLLLVSDKEEIFTKLKHHISQLNYSIKHCKPDEFINSQERLGIFGAVFINITLEDTLKTENFNHLPIPVIGIFPDADLPLPEQWLDIITAYVFIPFRKAELSIALAMALNSAKRKDAGTDEFILFKKLQKELENSRSRFETFMEFFPGAVFIKNDKSEYLFANKYMREKSDENEIIGKTPFDIFYEEDARKDIEEDQIALQNRTYEGVAKGRDKKNNPDFYRILKFPLPAEDGAPMIGGMALDISSLVKTQQDLKINEERLRLAVEAANAGTWDRSFISGKIYLSPWLREIFDLQFSEPIDVDFFWNEIILPEDRQRVSQAIDKHIRGENAGYEVEYRIKKSDDCISWLQERGSVAERDANGNPVRMTGVIIDITSRKELEETFREREELLKALIESLPDIAFVIDEDGKYVRVFTGKGNVAADARKRINKNFYDILPHSQADEALEIIKKTISSGESQRFEYFIEVDGEALWYEGVTSLMSFTKEGKKLVAWVARDMTAHKQLEKKLRDAKRMAENANRAKSEFLANMSHEIRTPMNNIIGMTDLVIETTQLDDEQQEYLEIIRSSSDHLLKIINDILNLSKIEAGKIQFNKNLFHLRETIEEIIYAVRPVAEKKNLKVEYNINENIPEQLVGDEIHLKQILYNLVGNAVKFTDEGGCLLSVKRNQKEDHSGNLLELQFSVEDTGIGIPKNMQESIFEAFSQAHHFSGKKPQGTGLGLSITKQIIEKLNGRISFSSEENVGSTFTFILPFELNFESLDKDPESGGGHEIIPEAPNKDALKLLIAEDNDLNQKLILRLLSNRGHQMVFAGNGREAVEKLRLENFDAIFMDIQMPEMDGVEATRIIRNDTSGDFDPSIPVVAVTAYAFEEDKYKFFEAGMNEFIPKPISSRRLDEVLQKLKHLKKEKSGSSFA